MPVGHQPPRSTSYDVDARTNGEAPLANLDPQALSRMVDLIATATGALEREEFVVMVEDYKRVCCCFLTGHLRLRFFDLNLAADLSWPRSALRSAVRS